MLAIGSSLLAQDAVTRVFIFAGQSNMVGSDSRVDDVDNFAPFKGYGDVQHDVRFWYCIGRENKTKSNGWEQLKPIRDIVGPELSFARETKKRSDAPIAIIKVAAGGTHLGGDWNPDEPQGFKMYPLALQQVRDALAELKKQQIAFRLEGFMWHQGENDMFNEEYKLNYGPNLTNFMARWRKDLETPNLKFYVGELCTKTIWGMDLRPRMFAISEGQKQAVSEDRNAEYIPTSHVGVEIGNPVGLHYHYGTLGQLEHGANYAQAYLRDIGKLPQESPAQWAKPKSKAIRLFILAGHRNMEGERSFVQDLAVTNAELAKPVPNVGFRFSLGGGVKTSDGWQALEPAGYYDTYGPELSFARSVGNDSSNQTPIAIAKFTHSGSQMNDWTPEGSIAKTRHLYPSWIKFMRQSIKELEEEGYEVQLQGIFYHVGENEMSMHPYRKSAAKWLRATIEQTRLDLQLPDLLWFVSQQPPTDHKNVNGIDVVSDIRKLAESDPAMHHVYIEDFPTQPKRLVLDTPGILHVGKRLAASYLEVSEKE